MGQCIAIIPVRAPDVFLETGELLMVGQKHVLEHTIASARASTRLERIFVSTDDQRVALLAKGLGAEVPFLRPPSLSDPRVGLPRVVHYTLRRLETEGEISPEPEVVVLLEVAHPFRNPQLIDHILEVMDNPDLESVFTVVEVRNNFWRYDEQGRIQRVYEADAYRHRTEKHPLYKEMLGLVCATRRRCITDEQLLGRTIGVVPVRDPASQVDLVDQVGRFLAESAGLLQHAPR